VAFVFVYITVDAQLGPLFLGGSGSTTLFMYFSLSSITTLGLGDLTAASDLGRFLSVSEAVIGQVFLVTIVALVVGLMGQRFAARGAAPAEVPEPDLDPNLPFPGATRPD
jgi:hypothetical protein